MHNCPFGYRGQSGSVTIPVLRGQDYCNKCLCASCLIINPPDFLKGSCGPHSANAGKRHRLYRLFWRLLSNVGYWNDEEYLQRKAERTTTSDRRELIPQCIIEVSSINNMGCVYNKYM